MKKLIGFILCVVSLGVFSQSPDCKIKKETIKKDGSIKYRTKVVDWLEFSKIVTAKDTLYLCEVWSVSDGDKVSNDDMAFSFTDGTKMSRPDAVCNTEFKTGNSNTGAFFKHTATIILDKNALEQFRSKEILNFTIKGGRIRHLHGNKGEKLQKGMACLISA
jgi:hypothetical protein